MDCFLFYSVLFKVYFYQLAIPLFFLRICTNFFSLPLYILQLGNYISKLVKQVSICLLILQFHIPFSLGRYFFTNRLRLVWAYRWG